MASDVTPNAKISSAEKNRIRNDLRSAFIAAKKMTWGIGNAKPKAYIRQMEKDLEGKPIPSPDELISMFVTILEKRRSRPRIPTSQAQATITNLGTRSQVNVQHEQVLPSETSPTQEGTQLLPLIIQTTTAPKLENPLNRGPVRLSHLIKQELQPPSENPSTAENGHFQISISSSGIVTDQGTIQIGSSIQLRWLPQLNQAIQN